MAGQDVDALVNQAVRRFGLLDRQRPVASENDLDRGIRIHAPRAQGEAIDIAKNLRDRLCRDKTELVAFGRQSSNDPGDIFGLVDIAKIGSDIVRMLARNIKAAAMEELNFWKLFRDFQNVRIVIAEGSRETGQSRYPERSYRASSPQPRLSRGHWPPRPS